MSSIFHIAADCAAFDALLAELDGDLSNPQVEAAIDALASEVAANRDAKIDAYCALIEEYEARAAARKAKADALRKLSTTDGNAASALRERLKFVFEANGWKKVETDSHRVSVRGNGGVAPLQIDDGAQIPERFEKLVVEPDRTAIRVALEGGEELPFARLLPRGTRLEVK